MGLLGGWRLCVLALLVFWLRRSEDLDGDAVHQLIEAVARSRRPDLDELRGNEAVIFEPDDVLHCRTAKRGQSFQLALGQPHTHGLSIVQEHGKHL